MGLQLALYMYIYKVSIKGEGTVLVHTIEFFFSINGSKCFHLTILFFFIVYNYEDEKYIYILYYIIYKVASTLTHGGIIATPTSIFK